MPGSGYNLLLRLFHRLSVGSKAISALSFDIEKQLFLKKDNPGITNGKHVFVSGLARSGTTALMNYLNENEEFISLTYKDMPFILAPNLWSKIAFNQKKTELKERAHNDGILINSESAEAFDEIFWKIVGNEKYILNDRLLINKLSSDILEEYKLYIDLILQKNYRGKSLRYLSKNNNNILRFDSILHKFPNSQLIIPFRDPLQQALSLLNQHKHFCIIQQQDRFLVNYMNWIGHYEFGLGQKPFFLNNKEIFEEMLGCDKQDINYWLLTWLNYYSYVLENYSAKWILFSHERFCEDPKSTMSGILNRLNIQSTNLEFTPFKLKVRKCDQVNKQIIDRCRTVYNRLLELS
jgi:Sulfotransferase family